MPVKPAPPIKNWSILSDQSFTGCCGVLRHLSLIWTASELTFTTIHLDILFAECTDSLLRGDCHVATKLAIGEACRTFILRGGRMSWTCPAVGLWGRAWRA